ncbi:MAG: hypothetical protein R6V83_02650 [Candidatus Thorarchaeota archaeon]
MHASRKTYNIAGIILTLIGLAIQIWAIMLKTYPSVRVSDLAVIGFILITGGTAYLIDANVDQLFSIHSRINYVISLIGLAGLIISWRFYGPINDLVYPHTIAVAVLMINCFWIFLLGPVAGVRHTKLGKE